MGLKRIDERELMGLHKAHKMKSIGNMKYICEEAVGAYPNDTRVAKAVHEEGDEHNVGDLGTVAGSIGPHTVPEYPNVKYFYFVFWDSHPDIPVGVMDYKIRKVEQQ